MTVLRYMRTLYAQPMAKLVESQHNSQCAGMHDEFLLSAVLLSKPHALMRVKGQACDLHVKHNASDTTIAVGESLRAYLSVWPARYTELAAYALQICG